VPPVPENAGQVEFHPLPERHELNWGKGSGAWFEWGRPKPCVLCGIKTELRSPRNLPCHKACAEEWNDAKREGRPLPTLKPR
jgi:hypothetical protein